MAVHPEDPVPLKSTTDVIEWDPKKDDNKWPPWEGDWDDRPTRPPNPIPQGPPNDQGYQYAVVVIAVVGSIALALIIYFCCFRNPRSTKSAPRFDLPAPPKPTPVLPSPSVAPSPNIPPPLPPRVPLGYVERLPSRIPSPPPSYPNSLVRGPRLNNGVIVLDSGVSPRTNLTQESLYYSRPSSMGYGQVPTRSTGAIPKQKLEVLRVDPSMYDPELVMAPPARRKNLVTGLSMYEDVSGPPPRNINFYEDIYRQERRYYSQVDNPMYKPKAQPISIHHQPRQNIHPKMYLSHPDMRIKEEDYPGSSTV